MNAWKAKKDISTGFTVVMEFEASDDVTIADVSQIAQKAIETIKKDHPLLIVNGRVLSCAVILNDIYPEDED